MRFKLIISLFLLSASFSEARIRPIVDFVIRQDHLKNVTLKSSIVCEQCEDRVSKSLLKLKGLKEVKTNLEDRTITVLFRPEEVTLEQIKQQISLSGYDADDLKANRKAFHKLPTCCKKQSKS